MIALATVLGLGGAALRAATTPRAATSTFVSSSSPEYRATQKFYENFGEEPIEVLVKGNLQQLVLSSDVDRLVGLEGCLSGNVPERGACAGGRRGRAVRAAGEGKDGEGGVRAGDVHQRGGRTDRRTIDAPDQAGRSGGRSRPKRSYGRPRSRAGKAPKKREKLGKQASSITLARFKEGLATLALQYGLTARPSLDDPSFVSTLVFDSSKPAGTPKARFAYLFPSREAALISVRLKAGLSEAQRTRTIALIREAVAMKQWRLRTGRPIS